MSFKRGVLIEINSHSLFSKWFSESGKLVQKLFDRVHDYAQDTESFVTVMIDEVESLTAARAGAMNGSEPGHALRVSRGGGRGCALHSPCIHTHIQASR